MTRSPSSLSTTPRSRNSAFIKLITTKITTKTLLMLASHYLAQGGDDASRRCMVFVAPIVVFT